MIYPKEAFDAFDTIFCAGPYHREEIRKHEKLYGLEPKNLVDYGYARLDSLIRNKTKPNCNDTLHVLVAPTWGTHSITDTCLNAVVDPLLREGFKVTLRLHPMSTRKMPLSLRKTLSEIGKNNHFHLETDMKDSESFYTSKVMISDWSGAAIEYVLGLEKPVIFVDVQPKVRNEEFGRLKLIPFEDQIRRELNTIVKIEDLPRISELIRQITARKSFATQELREKSVFNVGLAARVGAIELAKLLESHKRSELRSSVTSVSSK